MPIFGAPWFAPLAPLLGALGPLARAGDWPACVVGLNRIAAERSIVNGQGRPVRFIEASRARPIPYESHIWLHGEVPTRTGEGAWHDFFNALIWLSLPRTKAQLNALQAAAIERDGVGRAARRAARCGHLVRRKRRAGHRGPRPWLPPGGHMTGGACSSPTGGARAQLAAGVFSVMRCSIARAPYKSVCAHAWLVDDPALLARPPGDGAAFEPAWLARLDSVVAHSLAEPGFRRDAFLPCRCSDCPAGGPPMTIRTYDDRAVFRPLPAASPS
jgi:hypothetical protein